ncbi:MAG: mechanosensitive ion channel family protein [Actinomycetota bacterium]|nr:mechanosensitive ion channel family protein [Actinomycetota bacterium]
MLTTLLERYGEAATLVAIWTATGVAVDFVIYRVVLARTRARGRKTGTAIAQSVHWLPTITALLLGLRIAAARLPLDSRVDSAVIVGIKLAFIAVFTLKAAALAGRLIRIYTQREDTPLPSSTIFVNLARGTIVIVGALIGLAALDISITPLVTALGVGGLAVGLALQPTLENLFAGVQVLMSRQIEPGDFVRLQTGEEGYIQDVTWRNTTLKMLSNDLVVVPNAILGKSLVTNFTSLDEQHAVIVPVSVAYASDLDLVERVAVEVASAVMRETYGGVPDFEPSARFVAFGDSAIEMRVVMRAERYDLRFLVQHAFIKRLHARFAEEGIVVPFPQRTIHMAKENRS